MFIGKCQSIKIVYFKDEGILLQFTLKKQKEA